MDSIYQWQEEYSVGIPQVDAEHKRLFSLCQALEQAIDEDRVVEELDELMDQLHDYVHSHFDREERYMAEHDYPYLEIHRQEHDAFRQKIERMRVELANSDSPSTAPKLLAHLVDWLINHVTKHDIQLYFVEQERLNQLERGPVARGFYLLTSVMNRLKLWPQLIIFSIIPMLPAFVYLADDLSEAWAKMDRLQSMGVAGRDLSAVDSLIHELQKERGLSVSLLSGARISPELTGQRLRTDRVLAGFPYDQPDNTFSSVILELRRKVDRGQFTYLETLNAYTDTVEALLALNRSRYQLYSEFPELLNLARSNDAVARMKEAAGKERALGSAIIVADDGLQLRQRIFEYHTRVNAEWLLFNNYAGDEYRDLFRVIVDPKLVEEIDKMRVRLQSVDTGEQLEGLIERVWWEKLTTYIDQLNHLLLAGSSLLFERVAKLQEQGRVEMVSALTFSVVIVILLLSVTALLTRQFSVSLVRLTKGLSALTVGQTHVFVPGYYLKNELGDMAKAYNRLRCEVIRTRMLEKAERQAVMSEVRQTQRLMAERRRGDQFKHQSLTDSMTQLLNRRGFDQACADVIRRNQQPWVLALDIDHFKRVNDTWGHEAGDLVLIHFSRLVNDCLRSQDVIARVGGEEFMILLFVDSVALAEQTAERILAKVRQSRIAINDKDNLQITASIGVTRRRRDEDDFKKVLKRADQGLYQAKSAGRDQICFS